jgi:hypothetical protein
MEEVNGFARKAKSGEWRSGGNGRVKRERREDEE